MKDANVKFLERERESIRELKGGKKVLISTEHVFGHKIIKT